MKAKSITLLVAFLIITHGKADFDTLRSCSRISVNTARNATLQNLWSAVLAWSTGRINCRLILWVLRLHDDAKIFITLPLWGPIDLCYCGEDNTAP